MIYLTSLQNKHFRDQFGVFTPLRLFSFLPFSPCGQNCRLQPWFLRFSPLWVVGFVFTKPFRSCFFSKLQRVRPQKVPGNNSMYSEKHKKPAGYLCNCLDFDGCNLVFELLLTSKDCHHVLAGIWVFRKTLVFLHPKPYGTSRPCSQKQSAWVTFMNQTLHLSLCGMPFGIAPWRFSHRAIQFVHWRKSSMHYTCYICQGVFVIFIGV